MAKMLLTLFVAFVSVLTCVLPSSAQTPDEMIFSAKNYMNQKKYREAEVLLKKAFELQRLDGASEKELANTVSLLITVYEEQGRKQEADQLNEWAANMWASFESKLPGRAVTVFDAPIEEPTQQEEEDRDHPSEQKDEGVALTAYQQFLSHQSHKTLMDQYLDQLPTNNFSRFYSLLILFLFLQIGMLVLLILTDSICELVRDACFDLCNWLGKIWGWLGERTRDG
jgi:tetratricopeptide (TPR) repeat protein